jgi:hypothetical protein
MQDHSCLNDSKQESSGQESESVLRSETKTDANFAKNIAAPLFTDRSVGFAASEIAWLPHPCPCVFCRDKGGDFDLRMSVNGVGQ